MTRTKNDYLAKKIVPYDPTKVTTVEDALVALQGCSFQGRNLGIALEILTDMASNPECLRVLTLAGAMIPAGMEEIICQAIERKIIKVIVTTGANIIHSIVNAFESTEHQYHYSGTDKVDDSDLLSHRINRIYDTFLPEEGYENAENHLKKVLLSVFPKDTQIVLSPSELLAKIGPHLPGRNFLAIAAENGVPVFCGATSDSELAINLLIFRQQEGLNLILDEILDIEKFSKLIREANNYGTIILGGGVPRNWAQQVFPYLAQIDDNYQKTGYHYSVRFHSAVPLDGGLSGCTIRESISWGKYQSDVHHQSVWGDATVYFPLIMSALFQRLDRINSSSL